VAWIITSFNCKYLLMHVLTSHQPYGYPSLMSRPWQWMHRNPWCSLWHLYCYCARCQLPCGTKTITCASFNHVQLLLLTNQHCAKQKWNLHLSWCCHYWPNANEFISLILCNLRIWCLQCSSRQRMELWWSTPHWSIPLSSTWGIWVFTQTWCVFT